MFKKLQARLGEKAAETFDLAVDKTAAAVGTAMEAGSRVKALTADPDQSITVEAMVLVFIDTVRHDESDGRPSTRAEVIAAYRGREHSLKWISRFGLWGATAGYLSTLYSEATILCDVSDAADLGLSREELGARVLLLWGVMGDFDYALAAIRGEPDKSVITYLKSRLPLGEDQTNGMTKREVVSLLWQARSLRKGKADRGGSSVETMIDRAEDQLRPHVEGQ
jgi:hypothetical protein